MKKALFILLSLAVAAFVYSAISGSAHDFSDGAGFNADAWNTDGEICQPCHTPHNGGIGAVAASTAPLWNHDVTASAFTVYTGYDLEVVPGQPSGISELCLSCHDGSVSLDSFGGTSGTTDLAGSTLVGTDLSNDHPISFTYDTSAGADAEIFAADATINSWLQGGAGGSMECSSCHDVHNTANQADLLRVSNAASALCLTCHDK